MRGKDQRDDPGRDHRSSTVEGMDCCVTGCGTVVAEGGVCIVDSSSEAGRLPSLLPPHHIVVARRSAVVPRLEDALKNMEAGTAGGQGSSTVLISGPSRTADIEKKLVLGVHGPLSFTLLLLP